MLGCAEASMVMLSFLQCLSCPRTVISLGVGHGEYPVVRSTCTLSDMFPEDSDFACPGCPPSYISYSGHALRTRSGGVFDEGYLDKMRRVETASAACIAFGGRFWHVTILPNGSVGLEAGFCVPVGCSRADVQAIGMYTTAIRGGYDCDAESEYLFFTAAARLALRRGCWRIMRARVIRLSSWDKVHLDWAIVGFGSGGGTGGTTSLAYNLGKHPSMDLITDGSSHLEESFFLYNCELHVPTEKQVNHFNLRSRTLGMLTASDKKSNRGLLRGVKRGSYIRSNHPLNRLARIERLRVVVVMMDPVEVVERSYFKFVLQCSHSFDIPNLDDCIRWGHCSSAYESFHCSCPKPQFPCAYDSSRGRCHATWKLPLDGQVNYTRSRLEAALDIFGAARVFVTTQSDLNGGHAFWDRLAMFLGAPPFPKDMRFSRFNHNRTLVERQWSVALGVLLSRSHLLRGYCSGIALLQEIHREDHFALHRILQSLPGSKDSELNVHVPTQVTNRSACRARASERISYYSGGSMPVVNFWDLKIGMSSESR